jgi:hypothetical protein
MATIKETLAVNCSLPTHVFTFGTFCHDLDICGCAFGSLSEPRKRV